MRLNGRETYSFVRFRVLKERRESVFVVEKEVQLRLP